VKYGNAVTLFSVPTRDQLTERGKITGRGNDRQGAGWRCGRADERGQTESFIAIDT